MKVLVVAQQGQIRDALEKQLTIRKRAFTSVGLEWYRGKNKEVAPSDLSIADDIGMVVNALSLEALQQGADESLMAPLEQLLRACEKRALPLVHLSSSRVFDGLDGGVHRETDAAVPLSRLGVLLLQMEDRVRAVCSRHIVLRTGPLFSSVGSNLLTELLGRLEKGGTLQLSDNGDNCPVHTSDLVRVISAMIDQLSCDAQTWGTYHYGSADYVSCFKFAEAVLDVATPYLAEDNRPVLQPTDSEDLHWRCPLLNCEKILNTFGIKQLPWRAFIAPTLRKYFEPESVSDETVLNQSIQPVQKENFDG